jgi:hypothetical protein
MFRSIPTLFFLTLISNLPIQAQAKSLPQTPRQALIEVITAKNDAALMRHLPEATKAFLAKNGKGTPASLGLPFIFSSGVLGLGVSAKASGANAVDTGTHVEQSGPVLASFDGARPGDRSEITIENDDFRGDTDDLELAFHEYKNGEEQPIFDIGRVLLHMQLENGIWKFGEVGYSLKVKLDDSKFLNALSKTMNEGRSEQSGMMAQIAVETIVSDESRYARKHPAAGYTCSLHELFKSSASKDEPSEDEAIVSMLNTSGYSVAVSDCTPSSYRVNVTPLKADAKQRAFCADQTGAVRYSADGRAETCLASGRRLPRNRPSGIGQEAPIGSVSPN